MMPPKPVYTRRAAMIQEAGYDPADVPADAFDGDGFEIVVKHEDGSLVIDGDRFVTRHVDWPDKATSARARTAMLEDFAEMVGMTPAEWIREAALADGLTRQTSI